MPSDPEEAASDTRSAAYTARLKQETETWWKRALPTQLPYQLHLRYLRLGRTLDVGCGVGRNLASLGSGSVGVDHNATSVEVCRAKGLEAWTTAQFPASPAATRGHYDTILMAHLLEHVEPADAQALGEHYLPFVAATGRVVVICPQERGYASDPSHVWFVQSADIARLMRIWGLAVERSYSFPFPRAAGRHFTYNEFVVIGHRRESG